VNHQAWRVCEEQQVNRHISASVGQVELSRWQHCPSLMTTCRHAVMTEAVLLNTDHQWMNYASDQTQLHSSLPNETNVYDSPACSGRQVGNESKSSVTHAHTHTHTQRLTAFVWYNLSRPVPEETLTHSHPSWSSDILINFLHLLRSIASSLFSLRGRQSSLTTSLQVLFGLPLGLGPSTSYSMHFSPSHHLFRCTCPYQCSLFCCNTSR